MHGRGRAGLNESPSEKEGKYGARERETSSLVRLNESPSEKEGKFLFLCGLPATKFSLNESPSEKEGKYETRCTRLRKMLTPQ